MVMEILEKELQKGRPLKPNLRKLGLVEHSTESVMLETTYARKVLNILGIHLIQETFHDF